MFSVVSDFADHIAAKRESKRALHEIESRLYRSPPKPCAIAARTALKTLRQAKLDEPLVWFVIRHPKFALILYDRLTWKLRMTLNALRAVLAPLAATAVQAAYRRHRRRANARRLLQRTALRFLWRPNGWAHRMGVVAAILEGGGRSR